MSDVVAQILPHLRFKVSWDLGGTEILQDFGVGKGGDRAYLRSALPAFLSDHLVCAAYPSQPSCRASHQSSAGCLMEQGRNTLVWLRWCVPLGNIYVEQAVLSRSTWQFDY